MNQILAFDAKKESVMELNTARNDEQLSWFRNILLSGMSFSSVPAHLVDNNFLMMLADQPTTFDYIPHGMLSESLLNAGTKHIKLELILNRLDENMSYMSAFDVLVEKDISTLKKFHSSLITDELAALYVMESKSIKEMLSITKKTGFVMGPLCANALVSKNLNTILSIPIDLYDSIEDKIIESSARNSSDGLHYVINILNRRSLVVNSVKSGVTCSKHYGDPFGLPDPDSSIDHVLHAIYAANNEFTKAYCEGVLRRHKTSDICKEINRTFHREALLSVFNLDELFPYLKDDNELKGIALENGLGL